MNDYSVVSITEAKSLVSVPRAIATGSVHSTVPHDPVASTTPRGLPARGPRSAPGTDTSARNASLGDYFDERRSLFCAIL